MYDVSGPFGCGPKDCYCACFRLLRSPTIADLPDHPFAPSTNLHGRSSSPPTVSGPSSRPTYTTIFIHLVRQRSTLVHPHHTFTSTLNASTKSTERGPQCRGGR